MRVASTLVGVAALVVVLAGRADAYPQFQLSSGNDTCKQCHFSPAGGGLINEYGRDEAGSSLSMWEGNGGFLHGKWTPPEAFQIGADLRFVGGFKSVGDARCDFMGACEDHTEPLVFPMQIEAYLRPKIGPVTLAITAGARPSRAGLAFGSREHYAMYEPDDGTWYARAGRFFPVFGIRTQDHTAFVRRHTQQYLYEEPYGVAYGKFMASSEMHLSAFVRSPDILGTARDSGIAAYYEQRNEETTAAMAAQTRITISDSDRRAWLGGVYKRWMEAQKLLLMAELDLGVQDFTEADVRPRLQLVSYLSATYFAKQGLMIGAALQGYDPDVRVREASSREAVELNVQWLPIPHTELHLLTRYETIGWATDRPVLMVLSQLHYYL